MAKTKNKQIEDFAADLGTLLGTAVNKAERWLSERDKIVKRLTEVRDTASKLLTDLGHGAQTAGRAFAAKRRGRPTGSKKKGTSGIIIVGGRSKRRMSAKARKAISVAQKARWAKQKAEEKE
jgi:hypothetical protein